LGENPTRHTSFSPDIKEHLENDHKKKIDSSSKIKTNINVNVNDNDNDDELEIVHVDIKPKLYSNYKKYQNMEESSTESLSNPIMFSSQYMSQYDQEKLEHLESKSKWIGGSFVLLSQVKNKEAEMTMHDAPYSANTYSTRDVDKSKWIAGPFSIYNRSTNKKKKGIILKK
jgi:hypothetical protein